jgi:glycosyltransferase involved in cell wall biosynthesis
LPVDELISCYDQASALVHVPLTEAFGLVVAEALSRNLKLFASRVGGVSDIAANAERAELFSENDWEGLKRAIIAWIKQGEPRPTETAELMRMRYHPKEIAQEHLRIYREILRKP